LAARNETGLLNFEVFLHEKFKEQRIDEREFFKTNEEMLNYIDSLKGIKESYV